MELKRYLPEIISPVDVEMKIYADGNYVRYSDIEHLIEALKAYANAEKDQTVVVEVPYEEMDPGDFNIIEEFESGEPDNFGAKARQALAKIGVKP